MEKMPIELPEEYGEISPVFNIGDLSPYLEEDNLRTNSFQQGGNDEDMVLILEKIQPSSISFMENPKSYTIITRLVKRQLV